MNNRITAIKCFFFEYWKNLSASFFLAILVQKVLFERIKIESLVFLFVFFCILSFKKLSQYLLLIIAFLFSALIPTAILVKAGLLSQDFLSLAVTTSNEEIYSYIKSTPLQFVAIALLYWVPTTWLIIKAKTTNNPKIFTIFLMILFLLAYPFYNRNHLGKIYHDWTVWQEISHQPRKKPTWHITSNKEQDIQIYVIVLGESLRKDALGLYGNPVDTTPFLKSIPTQYITNYIATAPGTNPSIPRIFAMTEKNNRKEIHYENNIMNLAKEAGLETFWISSQGYIGKHEVGASSIATSADHIIVTHHIKEDFSLLPIIQSSLDSSNNRKLLVVHLWGSHENPCKHLDGIGTVFNTQKGKFIDCYFSSVRKTDTFLQRMTNILQSTGKRFKVIFFPDHALNFIPDGEGFIQYRDAAIKQSYEVPFIAFGSDIKHSRQINITQSAYNFTHYFPTWIGVETNLTPSGFDIFKNEDINPTILKYGEAPDKFSTLKEGLTIKEILK